MKRVLPFILPLCDRTGDVRLSGVSRSVYSAAESPVQIEVLILIVHQALWRASVVFHQRRAWRGMSIGLPRTCSMDSTQALAIIT